MLSVDDILQPENVSYTDNVWTWAVAHMLHNGEDWQITTITDTAPIEIVFLSKGEPLTDYLISGNTVQDGTPTPEAPVDVVGCGVRTGNLAYGRINGVNISPNGIIARFGDYDIAIGRVESGMVYTVNSYVLAFYANEPTISSVSYDNSRIVGTEGEPSTFTAPITGYIAFRLNSGEQAMLNTGSTSLPYEPYGYKLPLTIGGTEFPIFLGEVQTTRQIKKLVLTGEEGWTITSNGVLRIGLSGQLRPSTPLCTHYLGSNSTAWSNVPDKSVTVSISGYLAILDTTYTAVSDFKSYLAAQYAAGTPVTVWYVLAEPETAVVNEPLMKIGDYADTISMAQASVTIPTIAGTNTLTIDTAVQPSEISITGNIKEAST